MKKYINNKTRDIKLIIILYFVFENKAKYSAVPHNKYTILWKIKASALFLNFILLLFSFLSDGDIIYINGITINE